MYEHYGARGITVCKRWMKFENFIKDMGKKPMPEFSLDRIDVDKSYNKDNCRWASAKIQINNQQKDKIYYYNGLSMTLHQWIEHIRLHNKNLDD